MTRLSILAVATGARDDEAAIGAAADLAKRHGSSARVAPFVPIPIGPAMSPRVGGAAVAAQVWESLEERQDAIRGKIEMTVRAEALRYGLEAETLAMAPARDSGWATVMCELPLADLVVVAQSSVTGNGPWTGPLGEALMEGRAPVFVARSHESAAGTSAAIAWDGSLESGRAVRAALPLLQDASEIAILQDPDGLDTAPGTQADPARLAHYLALHGLTVGDVIAVSGRKIGPTLVEGAKSYGAGLLVAGAYRHSRLGEALFGGATRSFLHDTQGPHLLIAH